jgi:tetratricopeptide (TPR) repeat protein
MMMQSLLIAFCMAGTSMFIPFPASLCAQENAGQAGVTWLEQLLEDSGIGVVRDELHLMLGRSDGAGDVDLSELLAFGRRLQESGKVENAVAVLQIAVEAFPESPRARMLLGDAWAALGDFERQAAGYGDALAAIDKAELTAYLREHSGDLPRTAQEVIERHLDAIGGRGVLAAVRTMEVRYSGHDDGGETGVIVRQYKRPHYVRQYTVGRDVAMVTDGTTTWRVSDSGWTELAAGEDGQRPDITHDLIEYTDKGISYDYLGTVADDGTVFHKLRKIYGGGYNEDYFFAVSTGLLTRIASRSVIGPSELHYWDYSTEDGILMPHVFIVTPLNSDGTHGGIVRKVTLNPHLADSLFMQP